MLKMLRENPHFKMILDRASTPEERRAVKAHTEDFLLRTYDNLFDPIVRSGNAGPESLKKAMEEMNTSLVKSGSISSE